jgi:hypothetical protein
MGVGSTQEYFPGGNGSRGAGLTTLPPSCVYCLEIWEPEPPVEDVLSNHNVRNLHVVVTKCLLYFDTAISKYLSNWL